MSPAKQSPIEKIADWSCSSTGFYSDDPFYRANIPEQLLHSELFPLIANRALFRQFCVKNQIAQPAFVSEQQFDKVAAWAVKRNQFPLAIKSATNGSDAHYCYVLKAFRELPEFYEAITSACAGPVVLEEFINAKSRLEITFVAGLPRIISQFSLEKSMKMRPTWRVFPIRPPEALVDDLCAIARKFPGLAGIKEAPVRFSFVLHNARPMLISINTGLNRPEYHPDWSQAAGITNIFNPAGGVGGRTLCKLLIYYDVSGFSADELQAYAGSDLVKIASTEEQIMVLLRSTDAKTLLARAETIDTFFKHRKDSTYEPPAPEGE
ncbi:MAG: hypothetical protein CVV41_03845 [Candidatus Riflebacteria bacterium HGW-Riflebacteria-1]|jgi:hypothetical protein|nr:MAG: hypothetical protein CVV41_03845 [Candidatus Riflebacteria bacterium HGW-Riflebacteria-1]